MKAFASLLLVSQLALAANPFVIQQSSSGVSAFDNDANDVIDAPKAVPDLSAEQHQGITAKLRDSLFSWFSFSPSRSKPCPHRSNRDSSSSFSITDDSHGIIDFSDLTITEILLAALEEPSDDRINLEWHHGKPSPSKAPLHTLARFVNASAEAQKNLNADGITLLAPDDAGLGRPPHRRHEQVMEMTQRDPATRRQPLDNLFEDSFKSMNHPFSVHGGKLEQDVFQQSDSKDDSEDRRKRWEKIIAFFLKYHTLPHARRPTQLVDHATYPTTLKESSSDAESLRVRIEPAFGGLRFPHPSIKFNFYSTARGPVLKAKNGYIILVSAPLFPPLSPLNNAFLVPLAFSTLTSDVQKVGLADALLPSSEDVMPDIESLLDEATKETPGRWTIFAPTNIAFAKLGPRINAFLRLPLPLSRRILKYVLSYHVVPDVGFYSDHIGKDGDKFVTGEEVDVALSPAQIDALRMPHLPFPNLPHREHHEHKRPHPPPPPHLPPHHPPHHELPGRANVTHYEFPTLLSTTKDGNPNATLRVDVISYRLLGKGPIIRKVVILPAKESEPRRPPHSPYDEDDMVTLQVEEVWDDRRPAHEKRDGKKSKKAVKKAAKRALKAEKKRKRWSREQDAKDGPHHPPPPPRGPGHEGPPHSPHDGPHHPPHDGTHRPPHGGPHQGPVKVIARDVPARFGSIQVLPEVLRPPMPHHENEALSRYEDVLEFFA